MDDLLDAGYGNVTVLDISETALQRARSRLGNRAADVTWVQADVTAASLPGVAYDLWHDRAVFHFLTEETERHAYVQTLRRKLKPAGARRDRYVLAERP